MCSLEKVASSDDDGFQKSFLATCTMWKYSFCEDLKFERGLFFSAERWISDCQNTWFQIYEEVLNYFFFVQVSLELLLSLGFDIVWRNTWLFWYTNIFWLGTAWGVFGKGSIFILQLCLHPSPVPASHCLPVPQQWSSRQGKKNNMWSDPLQSVTPEIQGNWPQLSQCDSYLAAEMLGSPSWAWSGKDCTLNFNSW